MKTPFEKSKNIQNSQSPNKILKSANNNKSNESQILDNSMKIVADISKG